MSQSLNLTAVAKEVLAATKLHDAKPQERAARIEALRKVEQLQAQLEDPKEAMFRQFTYVRSLRSKLGKLVRADLGASDC